MINLCVQNFIPFSVLPLSPSGFKEKGRLKLSRTLRGLPGYKSPSVPPLFFVEKKGFSLLGISQVPKGTQAVNDEDNRITGLPFPPEGNWITIWCISLSCSVETQTPQPSGGMVTKCWPEHVDPRLVGTRGLRFPKHHRVPSPPTNQKKVHELNTHSRTLSCILWPSLLTLSLKTLVWKPSGSLGLLSQSPPPLSPCLAPAINLSLL